MSVCVCVYEWSKESKRNEKKMNRNRKQKKQQQQQQNKRWWKKNGKEMKKKDGQEKIVQSKELSGNIRSIHLEQTNTWTLTQFCCLCVCVCVCLSFWINEWRSCRVYQPKKKSSFLFSLLLMIPTCDNVCLYYHDILILLSTRLSNQMNEWMIKSK